MTTVTLDQALSKGHGKWRSFTCPVHEDANPSARVNVDSGKWVCMVCHAKGTVSGYVPDPDLMLEDAMSRLNAVDATKTEAWLDQYDSGSVHPYWLSRFSEEVCRAFRLGYDWLNYNPCYPIRALNGLPLGVVIRNLSDPDGPKYKYPRGVETSSLLFGLVEAVQTDVLFLTEGATSAMAVREAGHDALGTYGAMLHPIQASVIQGLGAKAVYVAYDMDRAGNLGAEEAVLTLNRLGVYAERVRWDDRWNDLGDMDLDTRSRTLGKVLASTGSTG